MKLNISYMALSKITDGQLFSETPENKIHNIQTDSRQIQKDDCFLAIKGPNHDAHNFLEEVIKKGACLIIGQKGLCDAAKNKKANVLEVENTIKALQQIAKYHRLNNPVKIAAITGSNGKSTTKQMLYSIASKDGKTCASAGNFNNHIGAPLSILEIMPDDVYGVFELGASHKGDIEEIAQIALPNVAVITNIAPAHLEFFGDLETVYQTKKEIADCLNSSGILVYNSDDKMLQRLKTDYKGKAITFGFSKEADVVINEGELFSFTYKDAEFKFTLKLQTHNKYNAAAACAAAIALGLFKDEIEKGLEEYAPMPLRLQEHTKNGALFILDCYNANPSSMENALKILVSKPGPHTAVLGDMRELGKTSKNYHEELAKQIIALGVQNVLLAGQEIKATYDALKNRKDIMVKYSGSYKDLLDDVKKCAANGGSVLIKASRALNFENIFKEI